MSTRISPLAGQPVPKALLIDGDKLVAAYYSERPDPSALEVLAANGVELMLATHDEPTPTPAVWHAILAHNRGVAEPGRRADGINVELAGQLGGPVEGRIQAPATAEQKARLAARSPKQIDADELAGEEIVGVLSQAPGNGVPIGGIKVCAKSGWYAARPSGTEDLYKIYAESFRGAEHLQRILMEAQATVDAALAPTPSGMRS